MWYHFLKVTWRRDITMTSHFRRVFQIVKKAEIRSKTMKFSSKLLTELPDWKKTQYWIYSKYIWSFFERLLKDDFLTGKNFWLKNKAYVTKICLEFIFKSFRHILNLFYLSSNDFRRLNSDFSNDGKSDAKTMSQWRHMWHDITGHHVTESSPTASLGLLAHA